MAMANTVMETMKKKYKNPKLPLHMMLSKKYIRFALFGLLAINPLEAKASDTSSPTYLQQMYDWITKDPDKGTNKETSTDPNKDAVKEINTDNRDTKKDTNLDTKNDIKVVETGASGNASPTYYWPNNHGKSLTTPVAWGASNNVIYMGARRNHSCTLQNRFRWRC